MLDSADAEADDEDEVVTPEAVLGSSSGQVLLGIGKEKS